MGEHYLGDLTDREIRISTAFGGGIGGTKEEACGVLTMGVAIISALYGRTDAEEDDQALQDLAALYRKRFQERLGNARCGDLQALGFGTDEGQPCSELVEQGARVLMEVIDGYRQVQA